MVSGVFGFVFWIASIAIFVVSLYALVEAIRTPAQAFPAMDKQTKKLWVTLLGIATAVTLFSVFSNSMFLVIASLIVALIYLLDVRPAVKDIGRSSGPYGPW